MKGSEKWVNDEVKNDTMSISTRASELSLGEVSPDGSVESGFGEGVGGCDVVMSSSPGGIKRCQESRWENPSGLENETTPTKEPTKRNTSSNCMVKKSPTSISQTPIFLP